MDECILQLCADVIHFHSILSSGRQRNGLTDRLGFQRLGLDGALLRRRFACCLQASSRAAGCRMALCVCLLTERSLQKRFRSQAR